MMLLIMVMVVSQVCPVTITVFFRFFDLKLSINKELDMVCLKLKLITCFNKGAQIFSISDTK